MEELFQLVKENEAMPTNLAKLRKQFKRKILIAKLSQWDLEIAFGLFILLFIIIFIII